MAEIMMTLLVLYVHPTCNAYRVLEYKHCIDYIRMYGKETSLTPAACAYEYNLDKMAPKGLLPE